MLKKRVGFNKVINFVVMKTLNFIFIFLFINVFSALCGPVNVLPGVAVIVSFMTLPTCNLGVKKGPMAIATAIIFAASGIAASLSLLNPWFGLVINFLIIFFIMLISCEPIILKPYIGYLLCYIFCQTTPVYGHDLVLRTAGLTLGGILIAVISYIEWRKSEYAQNCRSLKQQFCFSARNCGFVLRMSAGVAIAMFLAAEMQLKKPLWISIVVMSLTQLELSETLQRIKYRTCATIIGIILFVGIFQLLVPPQYMFLIVLFLGYICNYVKAYKYTQIINAISAINASIVLMDTGAAIQNRLLCLLGGIAIVLCFHLLWKVAAWLNHKYAFGGSSLISSIFNIPITEGSGANTKYYIQHGADSASKKLLGNMLYKEFNRIPAALLNHNGTPKEGAWTSIASSSVECKLWLTSDKLLFISLRLPDKLLFCIYVEIPVLLSCWYF